MFRTIKLKFPYNKTLIETAKQFKEATQIVLDYCFENKTFNKNKLNKGTYRKVRGKNTNTSISTRTNSKGYSIRSIEGNKAGKKDKKEFADSEI